MATSPAALAEANEAERVMGELRLKLDELSRDQLRFEHEIDSMSQKAAAEERRMYDGSVANARELDSIRHEVDNLKKRRGDREDELLGLMEMREELEAQERAADERSTALRARVEEVGGVAADELERLTTEVKERTEKRGRRSRRRSTPSTSSSTRTSVRRRRASRRSSSSTACARDATSSCRPSTATG